ncbi:MAG: malectin domain-containing carbohydrate-binding protein, partial [Cyanobacteria bacterium J06623_7]
QILLALEIDPLAATATPTISYETETGSNTVLGTAIDLESTAVLEAIRGNYTVNEQPTGLAVGLFSSNTGQADTNTFQAVFDDLAITATEDSTATTAFRIEDEIDSSDSSPEILYRVNAGGLEIAATDGGLDWLADTISVNSPNLVNAGSNETTTFTAVEPQANLTVPAAIFQSERWDRSGDALMEWSFDVSSGLYEVRLYLGNGYEGTQEVGTRVFDVAVEGDITPEFANIDPTAQFGHLTGGVVSSTVEVSDGALDLEFLHQIENPMVNGIEILRLPNGEEPLSVSFTDDTYITDEDQSQVQISLLASDVIPSDETLFVTVEIVADTAIALTDYEYLSDTATFDETTGTYTEQLAIAGSSFDATLSIDILADDFSEAAEMFNVNIIELSNNAVIGTGTTSVIIASDRDLETQANSLLTGDRNIELSSPTDL